MKHTMCCPTCPMSPDNEIDMLPAYMMYPNGTLPINGVSVVATPIFPVVQQPVVPQ